MGHKTRTKSKAGSADDLTNPKDGCELALTEFRLGNTETAFKLMKKALKRFKNCGLIYRVQATMFMEYYSKSVDLIKRNECIANAIDSATKAVQNSPDSIEFALFFADLYFKVATSVEDYDLVSQVCERALLVGNPVDPAESFFLVFAFETVEKRISHVQGELRLISQKAKKLQERRREIEAKVAEARQKQLFSDASRLSIGDEKQTDKPNGNNVGDNSSSSEKAAANLI